MHNFVAEPVLRCCLETRAFAKFFPSQLQCEYFVQVSFDDELTNHVRLSPNSLLNNIFKPIMYKVPQMEERMWRLHFWHSYLNNLLEMIELVKVQV
jgi:hypothetical protein